MASPHMELPLPRTWMLTVRALEVSALLLLVGILGEAWQSWRASGDYYPPVSTDGLPVPATVMQRVVGFVAMGSYGSPAMVMVPAFCVAAAVAVLHLAKPVENARVLRWEVLAAGLATGLYSLGVVLLAAVAVFGDDPFAAQQGGPPNGYQGPTLLQRAVGVGALPAASLVLVAAAALWWLRLPADFDEEAEDAEGAEGREESRESEPSVRPRRTWRPSPVQDANRDDFVLDGVEVIEPVERLHPRDDGGNGSGYEDYLRRF